MLKKPTCWSESENRDITLPLCFKTTTHPPPLPRLLLPSNCSSTHTGGFTHARILFLCLISLKSGGHDRTLADKLDSLVPPSFAVPTCVLPVAHRASKCCSATRCAKLGPAMTKYISNRFVLSAALFTVVPLDIFTCANHCG